MNHAAPGARTVFRRNHFKMQRCNKSHFVPFPRAFIHCAVSGLPCYFDGNLRWRNRNGIFRSPRARCEQHSPEGETYLGFVGNQTLT